MDFDQTWYMLSPGFQVFLRTKSVPSLVKIHWKMLILECSQGCYRVKIRPCDLDLWPMTLKINMEPYWFSGSKVKVIRSNLFTAYHPCEHSRINIIQWILTKLGTYLVLRRVWNLMDFTFDLWPWKSIGFQTLLRTKHVPSLVIIHWRMSILECIQGLYRVKIRPCDLDLWPWKSIRFQTLLRTKYGQGHQVKFVFRISSLWTL
jgi:hypothetical protein